MLIASPSRDVSHKSGLTSGWKTTTYRVVDALTHNRWHPAKFIIPSLTRGEKRMVKKKKAKKKR
jgi:hypothetical protein